MRKKSVKELFLEKFRADDLLAVKRGTNDFLGEQMGIGTFFIVLRYQIPLPNFDYSPMRNRKEEINLLS